MKPTPPIVRPLPDWIVDGVAIKMQQVSGVSMLTGLPVVTIGPVFVQPAKAKKRRRKS